MSEILTFAQTVSPLGVIALLVIVILQQNNGNGKIFKIRRTQEEKYPKLEHGVNVADEIANQLQMLISGQQKMMGNHLHELPEMAETMRRLDAKSDKMIEILTEIRVNTRR